MSIASPSLRSSSTTAPRPSFSNWLTCMVALPNTALTVTGMSYTASSSRAPRGVALSILEPADSASSASSISPAIYRLPDHGISTQESRRHQHSGDLFPQHGGVTDSRTVTPGNAHIAWRHRIALDDPHLADEFRVQPSSLLLHRAKCARMCAQRNGGFLAQRRQYRANN